MTSTPSDPLAARLASAARSLTPERLSQHVGEALWRNGWLLDRSELFDRCFVYLGRCSDGSPMADQRIDEVIHATGEGMVRDVLTQAPSAQEAKGFALHLMGLLGLAEQEAQGAQGRFHRLPLEDRRAFLSLLWAPDGHLASASMAHSPVGFEGLLDDESGTLARGAERALFALFRLESLHAKEADHD